MSIGNNQGVSVHHHRFILTEGNRSSPETRTASWKSPVLAIAYLGASRLFGKAVLGITTTTTTHNVPSQAELACHLVPGAEGWAFLSCLELWLVKLMYFLLILVKIVYPFSQYIIFTHMWLLGTLCNTSIIQDSLCKKYSLVLVVYLSIYI